MPTDVEVLMEMGFPQNRAEKAMAKTGYKSVQLAMDWLFAHSDDPDIDEPMAPSKGHTLGETAGGDNPSSEEKSEDAPAEAKSLKCDECGKLMKSELDVQAHAARTQHSSFSESTEEIKPLTEEEKKIQLDKLQERLKQKRLEKQEEEKKEKIAREKARRTTGKDMTLIKQKLEEEEIKKLAEQRRREKMEEKLARQRVKDEIEKDKRERAARAAKSSSTTSSTSPVVATVSSTPPVTSAPKEYTDCRLQIRLTNGQALTQTFKAKESLAAVRLYVEMNRTDGAGPFTLMTSFPRKLFTSEDMEKPLELLGLVPSAVLIVTKSQ
ncbi:UBX domain-containing protein 1 [Patella vulgata]|uniref:UBX domain-containing protein 1 n=1 Tax=Patella vulgata TaxID=6465 RepID=UPI00217F2A97|nr:UBX domain-containing protein 1 [Patella vulgata]